MKTGLVPRFPTSILATGLMIMGVISLVCGLILDSVARGRLEQKRIACLVLLSDVALPMMPAFVRFLVVGGA